MECALKNKEVCLECIHSEGFINSGFTVGKLYKAIKGWVRNCENEAWREVYCLQDDDGYNWSVALKHPDLEFKLKIM